MTETTPLQRAQIKASLYLMDTVSYIANAMSALEGRSECSGNQANTCNNVWNTPDPHDPNSTPGQNVPSYLVQNIRGQLPSLFSVLGSDSSQANIENRLFTVPNDNTDLNAAVSIVAASSLPAAKKAKAIAAFFLIDVIRYIGNNMAALASEPECVAGNGIGTAESANICDTIWNGNSPMSNLPVQLLPNANAIITLFRTAVTTDPEELRKYLAAQYLTDVNSDADLQIALCNVDPSRSNCPGIGTVTPDAVNKGDQNRQITISLSRGANIPEGDIKVELLLNGVLDPSVTVVPGSAAISADKTGLTFNINVANNDSVPVDNMATAARENARAIRVTIGNNVLVFELAAALTVNGPAVTPPPPPPPPPPTSMERASVFVHDKLRAAVQLAGGWVSGASVPLPLTAAADHPNLILRVGLGTPDDPMIIYGNTSAPTDANALSTSHYALAGNEAAKWIEIYGYFQGLYESYIHRGGHDDTNLGNIEAAVGFRFLPLPDHDYKLMLDVYGAFNFSGADYQIANRAYPTGMSYGPHAGLAVGSNFTTNWILGRAYGEYRTSWFNWDAETLSQPFSGREQHTVAGVELDLNFSRLTSAASQKWVPDLEIRLEGVPWGRQPVPDFWPVSRPGLYENVTGGNGSVTLNFSESPILLTVSGGYSARAQEGWDLAQSYYATAAAGYPKVGRFALTWSQGWNQSLFYGGDTTSLALKYTLPREWFRGAGAFSVTGSRERFDGQDMGGIYGGVDLMELIFPTVTQPASQPTP